MEYVSSSYQLVKVGEEEEDLDVKPAAEAVTKASFLPPGFRFSPSDEELCLYYLKRKISGTPCVNLAIIADIDLYKFNPEELPEKSVLKTGERVWYFFCRGDKKYQNGSRANRATMSGYWKITGRDRSVFSESRIVGSRKSLVFQQGRAPNGERTDWVMQEFALTPEELCKCHAPDRESYVVCKIFKKRGIGPPSGQNFGAPFIEKDWTDDTLVEDTEINREKLVRRLNGSGDAASNMFSVYNPVLPLSTCVEKTLKLEEEDPASINNPESHGFACQPPEVMNLACPKLNGQPNGIQRHASSLKHNGNSIQRNICAIKSELAEKRIKLLHLETRNRALMTKERRLNQELQEARKDLINGFQCFLNSHTEIGVKHFGDLNEKPFHKACADRFSGGEEISKALELISVWKQNVKDPEWHPFKRFHLFGKQQEVLDVEDEKLKRLKHDWGQEVYEAVATALVEMNQLNAGGRHPALEVWNFQDKRRATLRETIRYILKQLNRTFSNKRRK